MTRLLLDAHAWIWCLWIEEALKMPRLRVVELSPEIAWHATLLTSDRLIRAYPHVKTD